MFARFAVVVGRGIPLASIHQYCVCDRHFADSEKVPGTKRGLRFLAIPSLFMPPANPGEKLKSNAEPTMPDTEYGLDMGSWTYEPIQTKKNTVNDPVQLKIEEPFNEVTILCRLCMSSSDNTRNIFDEILPDEVTIADAIMACIWPLKISVKDRLSKRICYKCCAIIKEFYKFRHMCLGMDDKQREMLQIEGEEYSDSHCSDFSEDAFYEDLIQTRKKSGGSLLRTYLSSAQETTITVCNRKNKSEIDKKFDKVEEELRKVLEGPEKREHNETSVEKIIIDVISDDEDDQKSSKLTNTKLPFVIKRIATSDKNSSTPVAKKFKKHISPTANRIKMGQNEVVLPKGIQVSVQEKFRSVVGKWESTTKKYLFNTEFCMADGYLYEYRLSKGNVRSLHCIIPMCPSTAIQEKLGGGAFDTQITVQKPHNHKPPNAQEKKKHMFFYIMKRKMQSDKNLNFRSMYDEVCQQDPEIGNLVPLRNVINEICRHQLTIKIPAITSFEQFYDLIEEDFFQKLHFTHSGKQFYQERFAAGPYAKAVVFANTDVIDKVAHSALMYVDASFQIDTSDDFKYQLVTVLVWVEESYYPIMFALVNHKTQEIYKKIFEYLHSTLAPQLRPKEIVTDYEANLYYAVGETYLDSHIGGSVFYYVQNMYKKMCSLNLSRDLETNSYFRNVYHMLLMLPLLPVNTILDGLNNVESQAAELGLTSVAKPIFDHVRSQWMHKVTPQLFCVHRLENRINENVVAPFKKLRDFLMMSKGKMVKTLGNVVHVVEKLIELEHFLQATYVAPNKKAFARDLSSSQKKNVLKAWQFIESHPKININVFFTKVLGYIKCMENQLWIWGFYRFEGEANDDLINAENFSIVSNETIDCEKHEELANYYEEEEEDEEDAKQREVIRENGDSAGDVKGAVVMEAVIDPTGGLVLQNVVQKCRDF